MTPDEIRLHEALTAAYPFEKRADRYFFPNMLGADGANIQAIEVWELSESRALNQSDQPNSRRSVHSYVVRGTNDDVAAWNAVFVASPTMWVDVPRFQIGQAEMQGTNVWFSKVTYSLTKPEIENETEWDFEVGSETVHIKQSVQIPDPANPGTPANPNLITPWTNYPIADIPSGTKKAPDFKGAINVVRRGTEQTVQGTDVIEPTLTFTENKRWTMAEITRLTGAQNIRQYALILRGLVGKTNIAQFREFAAGEVQFMGARGSRQTNTLILPITYRFRAGINRDGVSAAKGKVEDIEFTQKAFEFAWMLFDDSEGDEDELIKKPRSVHVHSDIAPERDFTLMGIGGATPEPPPTQSSTVLSQADQLARYQQYVMAANMGGIVA